MATITADTFLDNGTARTAGEAWTMNGGVLTVRTDTRVHANAPAAMTGTLSNVAISAVNGGGILLDGRDVRWMGFGSGAGVVPAIGTVVSQGGVSGYLLGVWPDLASAPLAAGAAMPATGFLKFRSVTGGAFAVGALTGITANASEPDQVGWIEVVADQSMSFTVPRLGFFRTRGDWFSLGVTSGAAAQVIQTPTNGGGANTFVPGVWIETGVGTDVYEFYPGLVGTYFAAANLSTDARSKFVHSLANGQVRIGNDGTANAGFVPPAGCRIRMPNVIGRQCATATRAVNAAPAATLSTRPDFVTTSAGEIDMENFINDWYHLFSAAYSVKMVNVATFDVHTSTNEASPMLLQNYGIGAHAGTSVCMTLTSCFLGGLLEDCWFLRANSATNGHAVVLTQVFDLTLRRVRAGVVTFGRSTGRAYSASQCNGLTFEDCYQVNAAAIFAACFRLRINQFDHTDRFLGNTIATGALAMFTINTASDDIIIENLTFGLKGTVAGFHNCYDNMFTVTATTNMLIRNAGTPSAPLLAASAALAPNYIWTDTGACSNITLKRMFLNFTRAGVYLSANTTKNVLIESLVGSVGGLVIASLNTTVKGYRSAALSVTAQASVYGTLAHDMFISDTAGRVWWTMHEPTADNADLVTLTKVGALGGYTSAGSIALPTVGDRVVVEMPYFAKGHTAFANSAPTLSGTNTGNHLFEYDIDTGSGFSGTYKTVNGANLSAETISPSVGFKLRLRITTTVANVTNAVTFVQVGTVTTLSDQRNNLYPLETAIAAYRLTGLAAGTEVAVFNSANVELNRQTIVGTQFSYDYVWDSDTGDRTGCYALVWKDDKAPIKIEGITLGSAVQSSPVTQVEDRVYAAGSAISTFDAGNSLQILNGGTVVASVSRLYSDWKDWVRLSNNAQHDFAYAPLGGDTISGGITVALYAFLLNGWQIRPQEADHTLAVTSGILVAPADPFVDTLGAFTVRINYQQPVQVLTITSGSGVLPADITAIAAAVDASSVLAKEATAAAARNAAKLAAALSA